MAMKAFHITHDLEFDMPMDFGPNSTSGQVRAKNCKYILYLSRSDEGIDSLADECAGNSQALAMFCKPLDPRESGEVREDYLSQPARPLPALLPPNFAFINRDPRRRENRPVPVNPSIRFLPAVSKTCAGSCSV
jgi:hypothetical protein